ncbi:hypothetical protein KW790_01590 [Candidatus Parcubacteria bacterium]|nr:hypothetical protein [Candidatus Parcubacteria bacterium]
MKKFKLPTFERNGKFLGFGTSPKRDWKIIFLSVSVAAALVIAFCAYTFLHLNSNDTIVDKGQSAPLGLVNEKLLKKVVTYYKEKSARLETIKTTKDTILDPSL